MCAQLEEVLELSSSSKKTSQEGIIVQKIADDFRVAFSRGAAARWPFRAGRALVPG